MLCYTILFFTMNCYVMICTALHFTALHCTGPYSTLLYCTILYYSILYLCTCTEEKLGESAQEFSSNYLVTYIGKNTKQSLKELPESSQKTSKIPSKPPPSAPKNAPKIHLRTLPGSRPEKSFIIALSRVSQGSPKCSQKHPRGLLGTQLAHFYGQNAAIESITVFGNIFKLFLVLF